MSATQIYRVLVIAAFLSAILYTTVMTVANSRWIAEKIPSDKIIEFVQDVSVLNDIVHRLAKYAKPEKERENIDVIGASNLLLLIIGYFGRSQLSKEFNSLAKMIDSTWYWVSYQSDETIGTQIYHGEITFTKISDYKFRTDQPYKAISGFMEKGTIISKLNSDNPLSRREIVGPIGFRATDIVIGRLQSAKFYYSWMYTGHNSTGMTRLTLSIIDSKKTVLFIPRKISFISKMMGEFYDDSGNSRGTIDIFKTKEEANKRFSELLNEATH